MDVRLSLSSPIPQKTIAITGSKSETNRLLLLNALYGNITIINTSRSDDSTIMQQALLSANDVIDVHHAGTAMRFLTAYFSVQQGCQVILTGSQRMKQRPIKELVDALRSLGAGIEYTEEEGFPPLKIIGKKLIGGKVAVNAGISSQYITALLLIAPKLQKGLELLLKGEITSRPYIDMTLALFDELGINYKFKDNVIAVNPTPKLLQDFTITVESDWSSASYYYAIVALSPPGTKLTLSAYNKLSRQGDSALPTIFDQLDVETAYNYNNTITISKVRKASNTLKLDLSHNPDLAQTIAVTCFGIGAGCELTGLHTLKIKETDRLIALRRELTKFGAQITVTENSLSIKPARAINENIEVDTYNDHRMALAFAPLAATGATFVIKDAGVVSKSYPTFWEDLKAINFSVECL